MDYSFNSIIERNNTILNSSTTYLGGNGGGTGGGSNGSSGGSGFKAVRVISIILDDLHPRWDELGQWAALGAIMYDEISTSNGIGPGYLKENIFSYPVAYPVNSFIKHYPLLNEIIYLVDLPSNNLDFNPTSTKKYYMDSINLWNHPHHNGYPLPNVTLPSEVLNDYTLSTGGTIRRIVDDPNISNTEGASGIDLGDTFVERPNIHPLHPFEGDTIIEGRWGNSIRFGSTVTTFDNSTDNLNPWSDNTNKLKNGDPITIIRNGQGNRSVEGWSPIIEDINEDLSSIYLTSTQAINNLNKIFENNLPHKGYKTDSYISLDKAPPISLQTFDLPQIVLNSDRILLNSQRENIIINSPIGDIHLSAGGDIMMDTGGIEGKNVLNHRIILNSDKLFLGNPESSSEPLVLGLKFHAFLNTLLTAIVNINNILSTAETGLVVNIGQPVSLGEIKRQAILNQNNINDLTLMLGPVPTDSSILSKKVFAK